MIPFAKTDPITITVDRLTGGPWVALAEERFAKRIDRPAVAVSSCAAALYMAIKLSGTTRVVIPHQTHVAILQAAKMAGVHYSFGVGNTSVHYIGIPDRREVLIEDAATGLGVEGVGHYGDYACFSFHPSKELSCGEGGMLVCDDPTEAKRMRSFQGEHGFNFRMTEMQAAVLCKQLDFYDAIMDARRRNHDSYCRLLGFTAPSTYCYRLQTDEKIREALKGVVEMKTHYAALPGQPGPGDVIDLPVGPHVGIMDIERIARAYDAA